MTNSIVAEYETWHSSNFGRPIEWYGIPERMKDGISWYLLKGKQPGHFLSAVFQNDFMGALNRADDENINLLKNYGYFLYNSAPGGAFGSIERYQEWVRHNGLSELQ